jgi:hypothetical protein
MSLHRAFTTRKANLGDSSNTKMPTRSNTTTIRHKISAPIELVHTTNMLSYNAPDLPRSGRSNIIVSAHAPSFSTSSSPRRSEDDSDTVKTFDSTPPTSPDIPSSSVVKNHLSTYFTANVAPATDFTDKNADSLSGFNAPTIPTRAPSHTKKASEDIHARKAPAAVMHRQRSVSNMSKSSEGSISTKNSMTFSRSSSTSTNTSSSSHRLSPSHSVKKSAPPMPAMRSPRTPLQAPPRPIPTQDAHPFGQELAQVTELVEEFGSNEQAAARRTELAADDAKFASQGRPRFTAADYLRDVEAIYATFFPETVHARAAAPLWI